MSPKNKGKYRKSEAPIEVQDEFVSGMSRLGERLKPHAVGLAIAAGVAAVALVGYLTWDWYETRQRAAATTIYAEAMAILDAPIEPVTPEGVEPPAELALPEPKGFATAKARAEAALAVLDRLQAEYGDTNVADEALLLRAAALVELDRYDDALAAYEAFLAGGTAALRPVALEAIGYAYEAKAAAAADEAAQKAALRQALEAFQRMAPQENSPRRDVALYQEGADASAAW